MPRIDRRTFLTTTGFACAAASLAAGAPAIAQPFPDVIVVGAGAFGAWTALVLRERGANVTLLDAFGPGNSRATSGGETRQIRVGYGDRELYSRWVLKAFERWQAREQEFGVRLLYRTGRLQLAPGWNASLEATKNVFDRLRVAHEVIRQDDLRRRFSQMAFDDVDVPILEPGAAVIKARGAIMAVAGSFEQKGGSGYRRTNRVRGSRTPLTCLHRHAVSGHGGPADRRVARLPAREHRRHVWIAGGGSGHGFKHGPVVGEYIADRATGRDGDLALEPAFRLKQG